MAFDPVTLTHGGNVGTWKQIYRVNQYLPEFNPNGTPCKVMGNQNVHYQTRARETGMDMPSLMRADLLTRSTPEQRTAAWARFLTSPAAQQGFTPRPGNRPPRPGAPRPPSPAPTVTPGDFSDMGFNDPPATPEPPVVTSDGQPASGSPDAPLPAIPVPVATPGEHYAMRRVRQATKAREEGCPLNVWLWGPPGCGKSYAGKALARELGTEILVVEPVASKFDVTGYRDGSGQYVPSKMRKVWEHGGVILFDEIRGSVPAALTCLFGAFANHVMPFADADVPQHPECYVIVGDNLPPGVTDPEYSGGYKQDGALKSRFAVIHWGLDEALEASFVPDLPEWLAAVRAFRRAAEASGAKACNVTPRATRMGAAMLRTGAATMAETAEMVVRCGLSDDAWRALKSAAGYGRWTA